jgi:hypothetical protein
LQSSRFRKFGGYRVALPGHLQFGEDVECCLELRTFGGMIALVAGS